MDAVVSTDCLLGTFPEQARTLNNRWSTDKAGRQLERVRRALAVRQPAGSMTHLAPSRADRSQLLQLASLRWRLSQRKLSTISLSLLSSSLSIPLPSLTHSPSPVRCPGQHFVALCMSRPHASLPFLQPFNRLFALASVGEHQSTRQHRLPSVSSVHNAAHHLTINWKKHPYQNLIDLNVHFVLGAATLPQSFHFTREKYVNREYLRTFFERNSLVFTPKNKWCVDKQFVKPKWCQPVSEPKLQCALCPISGKCEGLLGLSTQCSTLCVFSDKCSSLPVWVSASSLKYLVMFFFHPSSHIVNLNYGQSWQIEDTWHSPSCT